MTPQVRRAAGALGCLGALLVTAACGTTVSAGASGSGTTPQGELGAVQPGQTGNGPVGSSPAGTAAAGGTTGFAPTTTRSLPPSLPHGGPADVPLGALKPVVVGVITSGNVGAFGSSLGLDLNYGDQRAQAQLVAKYINAHGGVRGHQIRLVYYDYNAAGGGPGNAQSACSAFTEDNHAFAAIGIAGMDDAYHACAAKHGMFVLSDGDIKSTTFFRHYPTTIEISDMELVRKYHAMVLALKDMGFFTRGAKIGLVYLDEPNDLEGVRAGMKPTLASIGITPTDEVAVNASDEGQYVSQLSSAILKFRAEGVTHVVFGDVAAWTFAQAADKQRYYPAMGIDSRQSPGLLMQTVDSQKSLAGTMGIGYQPVQDVDGSHDPGPVSAHQRLCTKLYDDAGQGWGSNRLAMASALYLCDQLFFLHDAFTGAGDLSRQSFLQGVASLGSRYGSSLTFATRFSATQHDGAQGYRPLRYDTRCGCFVYAGPVRLFR